MAEFNLRVVTPDGVFFDGLCKMIVVRTASGDVGIMAGHAKYLAPLSVGACKVTSPDGSSRTAACCGGMISVVDNLVTIVASTFEWADEIDVDRAQKAADKAKLRMDKLKKNDKEWKLAEFKLKRALNRINIGKE